MSWVWIVLGVLAAVCLGVYLTSYCLYRFAMYRLPFPWSREMGDDWVEPPKLRMLNGRPFDPYGWAERILLTDTKLYEQNRDTPHPYSIRSHDGLTLNAKFFPTENMRGIVLMVHGYRSSAMFDFSSAVCDMQDAGFGCFLIHQRAHRGSEGDVICFGVKERYDVRDWARLLEKEFPGMPVILDGVSMGGATVLAAGALPDLPKNVRGIIADCGYTCMHGIFSHLCGTWFHLPTFPFLPLAERICQRRNGFGFSEVDGRDAIRRCPLPVIIAHGTGDDFVPYYMAEEIYAAAGGREDVWLFSAVDAGHGLSYLKDYDGYCALLARFFDRCAGPRELRDESSAVSENPSRPI